MSKGAFMSYDCHLLMNGSFVRQILQNVPFSRKMSDN